MIRSRIFTAFLPLLFLVAACNRSEPTPTVDQPLQLGAELALLEVPTQAGSAHPQLTTSPKGAILIAAPLKIQKGTGSPIRAMALVPKG